MAPFRTEFRPADYEQLVCALKAEIGSRVRPLISHWPATEIDALLDQMARIKLKYDGIDAASSNGMKANAAASRRTD